MVVVYIGGCFAESCKEADSVTIDEQGNLHLWNGDEYIREYPPDWWEHYEIKETD